MTDQAQDKRGFFANYGKTSASGTIAPAVRALIREFTGVGATGTGSISYDIKNIGGSSGTIDGVTYAAGESHVVKGGGLALDPISFDATGTTFRVLQVVLVTEALEFNFITNSFVLDGIHYAAFGSIPGTSSSGGVNGTVIIDGIVIPASAPRIGDGGLLVEEARTNLATFSEDFGNGVWNAFTNSAITTNATTAPDEALTADELIEDTATGSHFFKRSTAAMGSVGVVHTWSVFIKRTSGASRNLQLNNFGFNNVSVVYDLDAVTASTPAGGTSPSASIVALANGWFRVSLTDEETNTNQGLALLLYDVAGGSSSYTGDGVSGLYFWGAQFEAGLLSSYVPTAGSTVTRTADSVSQAVGSFFKNTEGTAVLDFTPIADQADTDRFLSINDGTTTNRIDLHSSSSDAAFVTVSDGGVAQMSVSAGTYNAGVVNSLALGWLANDFAASLNGAAVVVDASGSIPVGLTTMDFGDDSGGSKQINGLIRKVTYFPRRLTNAELIDITS